MGSPLQWCDLPAGIVDLIAKLLKSDIDRLRLRSVCSSWRSSVSPRLQNSFCFPLEVPPACNELLPSYAKKPYFTLHEDTLYRLSPLTNGNQAGYSSNDWMLKVSGTNRNALCLLQPLSTEEIVYPPGSILKCLNLLDCRISEVCKSYRLDRRGSDTLSTDRKVIVLWDYILDCDFAVLAVVVNGGLLYWKFGDENWSPIDTKGHIILDVIPYDGKCFAIDSAGVLVSFDSNLQLTVIAPSSVHNSETMDIDHLLLEWKSELYLVSRFFTFFRIDDPAPQLKATIDLTLRKFNECNGGWDCIEDLGDNVFLLGHNISVCVSAKDFESLKRNSVYLTDLHFTDGSVSEVYGDRVGIYRLDDPKALTAELPRGSTELNWHLPSWLMPGSSSPEP